MTHRTASLSLPVILLLGLTLLVSACTPMIYGVPEERWRRMDDAERTAARAAYEERRRQREIAAAERRRQQAVIDHDRQLRAAEEARRRQERVEAIHRGDSGVYGDLIQVTVSGGSMEFGRHRHGFEPVTFRLANGEQRTIRFRATGSRREMDVPVSYADGTFTFDSGRGRQTFQMSDGWRRGASHTGISLGKHSTSDGQHLAIRIQIVPTRRVVVAPPRHDPGNAGRRHGRPVVAVVPPGRRSARLAVATVESAGLYPHDLHRGQMGRCINMSPYPEHHRANTGLKSFVIEHNGVTAVVDALDARNSDPSRRRTICRPDRRRCHTTADWLAVKVNGTTMFLHEKEVKRLRFANGSSLLLSVIAVHGRGHREGSGLCWN